MASLKEEPRRESGRERRTGDIQSVTLYASHLTDPARTASLMPLTLVSTRTARYMLNAPRSLADNFSDFADREILKNPGQPGTSLEKRFGALGARAVAASAQLPDKDRFGFIIQTIEAGIPSAVRAELGLFGKWLDVTGVNDNLKLAIASEYLRD